MAQFFDWYESYDGVCSIPFITNLDIKNKKYLAIHGIFLGFVVMQKLKNLEILE